MYRLPRTHHNPHTKATIAANVYTNHLNQVTAEMVKTAINAVVDTIIAGGFLYKGVAIPSTNPGSPDANVAYIATTPGTYTNFGSLVVADGEVAVLKYNGSWTKEVTGAATAAEVSALGHEVSLIGDDNALVASIVRTNSSGALEEVLVDVSDNKEYTITSAAGSETIYLKFYDTGETQVGEILVIAGGTTRTLTPPTNAVSVGFRSYRAFSATMTTEGEIPLIKDVLNEYLPIVEQNKQDINGQVQTYDKTGASNATHKTSGSIVETTSPNTNVAEKIFDVSPGQSVTIYGYGSETYRLWAFADDLGNIIDKSAGSVNATSTPQTATAPSGATKLYVACYYNYIDYLSVTIKTKGLLERVDNIEDVLSVTSIKGKKAYFIGDSVMIGQPSVDAVKNITSFIQDNFGCECHNNAAGGSVIVYPWYAGNAYSIYYQLTQVPNSADYIIIQGGLNGVNMTDPGQQNYAPMGQISQSFTDNFDKTTQIGCLEAICKYLYDNFSSKKYGFIMNYEIGSYDYWREKAELFMQVLKKWSIPVLDWRDSGVSLASLPQYSKYGIDAYALYPAYDESDGYSVDDKVVDNGSTYKANENIPAPAGAFDSTKWTLVSSQRYDTWHCNRLAYEKLAYITAKWMETL